MIMMIEKLTKDLYTIIEIIEIKDKSIMRRRRNPTYLLYIYFCFSFHNRTGFHL